MKENKMASIRTTDVCSRCFAPMKEMLGFTCASCHKKFAFQRGALPKPERGLMVNCPYCRAVHIFRKNQGWVLG